MRWLSAIAAASVALLLPVCSEATVPAPSLSVSVDRTRVSTTLGHTFDISTRIENRGARTSSLVAHLNVVSLRRGVYVDPEDWSSHRTRYIGAIPAGASRRLTWQIKAVNSGEIAVYIAVLQQSGAPTKPTSSPTVHVAIGEHMTLNAGGIVPLAVGVPLVLIAAAFGARLRRRTS